MLLDGVYDTLELVLNAELSGFVACSFYPGLSGALRFYIVEQGMHFIGQAGIFIGSVARVIIQVAELLIIIQVILSWLNVSLPLNQLTRLFYAVTDAVYRPIRAAIPTVFGGLDISPLLALAALYMIDRWIIGFILHWGYQLSR